MNEPPTFPWIEI